MKRISLAILTAVALVCGCGPSAEQREAEKELELARLAAERGDRADAIRHAEASIAANDNDPARSLRERLAAIERTTELLKQGKFGPALDEVYLGLEKCPGDSELASLGVDCCEGALRSVAASLEAIKILDDADQKERRAELETLKSDYEADLKGYQSIAAGDSKVEQSGAR